MTIRDLSGKTREEIIQVDLLVLAPKIKEALRAAVREMAIEYGVYYTDERELEDRIDKCIAVGAAELETA